MANQVRAGPNLFSNPAAAVAAFSETNSVMFDPRSANNAIDNTSTFGRLTAQLGQPRQVQFALRYEF